MGTRARTVALAVALLALGVPATSLTVQAEQLPEPPPGNPPQQNPPAGNPIIFVKHAQTNAVALVPNGPAADPLAFYRNAIGFPTPGFQNLGGNLFRWDPGGAVTNLTNRNEAAVRNPDISFDGNYVLFAMKIGLLGKWQIYEMGVDGTRERLVSRDASHNDLDPAYLPDGRIVFTSDRQRFIDPYTEWPSAQLHLMDADGTNIVQLSSNPGGEFSPTLTSTGLVSFTRWDVKLSGVRPPNPVDVSRFQLWTMTPDGENDGHPSFGAHSRADFAGGYLQAREMPDGSDRFVATISNDPFLNGAGALVFLSLAGDQDQHAPAFITDELAFTKFGPQERWRDPFPTSQGDLLASRAAPVTIQFATGLTVAPAPNFGIVRVNLDGSGAQLVYDDPNFSEWEPVEVAPRTAPPVLGTTRDTSADSGVLNALDVILRGANPSVPTPDFQQLLPDEPGLKVRVYQAARVARDRARIFDAYTKATPVVLGDARVREDGSFAARLRANIPIS